LIVSDEQKATKDDELLIHNYYLYIDLFVAAAAVVASSRHHVWRYATLCHAVTLRRNRADLALDLDN
jgi:hypothetical protein